MKIFESKNGAIMEVFVKPNSPKFKVNVKDEEIVVFSSQEPIKGKVNKELLKELTRLFHANVEIVSGLTSKQKKLLIRNVGRNEVERILSSI